MVYRVCDFLNEKQATELFQHLSSPSNNRMDALSSSSGTGQYSGRCATHIDYAGFQKPIQQFRRRLIAELPQVFRALGVPEFEYEVELQATVHNDGDFFADHTDNGTLETAGRVITFVCYFHGEPKFFSGGDLKIFLPDGRLVTVPPQHNSIIFFNSSLLHRVEEIVSTGRLEDGRFTLNGWITKTR